jgi:hypothetical protein
MTDRELLTYAAKAAGYTAFHGHAAQILDSGWNPLTDDGDALRLAVKLHIGILQCQEGVDAVMPRGRRIEGWGENREESTRRAIVRAAAEIGRAM